MLSPIDDEVPIVGTTATKEPVKTILQMFYGTTGTLLYTVPTGRKFKGYFWPTNSVPGYIVTGGGSLNNSQNGTYTGQSMWPPYDVNYTEGSAVLELNAGDALYSGGSTNYRVRVVGIESDV